MPNVHQQGIRERYQALNVGIKRAEFALIYQDGFIYKQAMYAQMRSMQTPLGPYNLVGYVCLQFRLDFFFYQVKLRKEAIATEIDAGQVIENCRAPKDAGVNGRAA